MSANSDNNDKVSTATNDSLSHKGWKKWIKIPIVAVVLAGVVLGVTQFVADGTQAGITRVADVVKPPPVVNITIQDYDGPCSSYLVAKQPLGSLGASPESRDFAQWGREHGTKASPQRIIVTVTGYDKRPVTLNRMQIYVPERNDAITDGYQVENQCGDETVARYAEINLDVSPPQIIDSSADAVTVGMGLATKPLQFPYTVSGSDTESLLLIANTNHAASWYAEIDWSNGEDQGILTIDQDGEPFAVMSGSKIDDFLIPDGEGGWVEL